MHDLGFPLIIDNPRTTRHCLLSKPTLYWYGNYYNKNLLLNGPIQTQHEICCNVKIRSTQSWNWHFCLCWSRLTEKLNLINKIGPSWFNLVFNVLSWFDNESSYNKSSRLDHMCLLHKKKITLRLLNHLLFRFFTTWAFSEWIRKGFSQYSCGHRFIKTKLHCKQKTENVSVRKLCMKE